MTPPLSTNETPSSHQRDAGLRLDGGRLRHEFRVRGVTGARVAELAGTSPNTVSRALAGDPISERTLRSIVRVLIDLPMLPGAIDLVTSAPLAHPDDVGV